MSALARYFVAKGCVVSGYDKTQTILTEALSELGIDIHYEDSIDLLDKNASVVVYTHLPFRSRTANLLILEKMGTK